MSDPAAIKQKRVLIVDDNPINRTLAAAFVRRFGMCSEEAEDGVSALAKLDAAAADEKLKQLHERFVAYGHAETENFAVGR